MVSSCRQRIRGLVGAHLDYFANEHLILRGGYRYIFSLDESDPYKEHRVILEQRLRPSVSQSRFTSDSIRARLARPIRYTRTARYLKALEAHQANGLDPEILYLDLVRLKDFDLSSENQNALS